MAWTVNSPLEKATLRHLMGIQVLTDTLDRSGIVLEHYIFALYKHLTITAIVPACLWRDGFRS